MDFRTNINIDRLSLEIKHIFMAVLSLIFGASEVFGALIKYAKNVHAISSGAL